MGTDEYFSHHVDWQPHHLDRKHESEYRPVYHEDYHYGHGSESEAHESGSEVFMTEQERLRQEYEDTLS